MIPPCRPPRSSPKGIAALALALLASPGIVQAETHVVELGNFEIQPPSLIIHEGDVVEWRIVSGRHSSTAKDGAWDSGEMTEDATFTQRFDVAGVYPYFCTPHDFMRGTITVLEAPGLWDRLKAWWGA